MLKDNKLVGQPILSQILSHLPKSALSSVDQKHPSNTDYKKISIKIYLTSMFYGVLSYCIGSREIF